MTLVLALTVWVVFWLQPGRMPLRFMDTIQSAEQSINPATPTQTAPAQPALPENCSPQDGASSNASPCKNGDAPVVHKKRRPRKPATPTTDPAKTVVRNGGTSDTSIQFSPSVSKQQASQETGNTNQLLSNAEANLKTLSERSPDAEQQETISQIKTYVRQAKVALDSGDVERAHKLAVKASVLTNDMVKH